MIGFAIGWLAISAVSAVVVALGIRNAPRYPSSYDSSDADRCGVMVAKKFAQRHAKWDHPHQWRVEV